MATPKTGPSHSAFFSSQYGLRFAVNLKVANLHSQFYQALSGRIRFDPKIHIFLCVPCILEFWKLELSKKEIFKQLLIV